MSSLVSCNHSLYIFKNWRLRIPLNDFLPIDIGSLISDVFKNTPNTFSVPCKKYLSN